MRKLALVILGAILLVGMASAQEMTFGKFGIGVGYGSQSFLLNTMTPYVYMNGTHTDQYHNPDTTIISPLSVLVSPMSNVQAVSSAIPFDVTWRPIEALGVRVSGAYLLGSKSFKESQTINETEVDTTNFGHIITTTITGPGNRELSEKISGFPFAFSLMPAFKIGDKVLLQAEGGVAYYNVSLKGDKGTYSQSLTYTQTNRDTANHTTTIDTYTSMDAAQGKMPDVKYSGLGTFWGFEAQVLVQKNVAIRTGFRKGGATLKEKYTELDNSYYQTGYQTWQRHNDQNTVENSLHVSTETYSLGLVYNFTGL